MSRLGRALLAVSALAAACRSGQPAIRPAAEACSEGGAPLLASSSARALAGEYRLSVAATSGPRAGAATEGRLALRPLDDSLVSPVLVLGLPDSTSSHPLAGTVELDVAAVGATATGDLTSADPEAPGALVVERRPGRPDAPVEITLRLGADANRRGVTRFDGGFFALRVRRMGADGFAGTWASGGPAEAAAGSFCAARTTP